MVITYKVKITRKFIDSKFERFIQGEFYWDLDVYSGETYMSSASKCGWAKTPRGAKSKVLKIIKRIEKEFGDSEGFGIVFQLTGTAEEMKKVLK